MSFESPITVKLWSRKLADELARNTVFRKLLRVEAVKPLSILERLKWRLRIIKMRVRDAYLVLTDQADIEDEDY